jgi:hypothetical protein
VSKLKLIERIENIPRIKLPTTLIISTFIGRTPNNIGDDAILYLRNAPANAPTANNTISMPFIFYYLSF